MLRYVQAALLVAHWSLIGPTQAQLIRERNVQCLSTSMTVTFDFTQPFTGTALLYEC